MTRVQDLLMRWEDDSLSEAEQQELITLLENDPQPRRLLVREWSLSSALARLLSERAAPAEPGWKDHRARDLAQHRGHRPSPWGGVLSWWPVAAAATLLLVIGGWWSTRPAPLATVMVADGGGPVVGSTLHAASTLTLPAGARVELRLRSGSEVTLTQQADLRLNDAQHLVLGRGRAELTVVPRVSGEAPFLVSTPHGTTRVLGTVFSVAVEPAETVVQVSRGQVQIERSDGASVTAEDGQRVVLRPDRQPVIVKVWQENDREALLITGKLDLDAGELRLLEVLTTIGLRPRVVLAAAVQEVDVAHARLVLLCNRIALPDLEQRLRNPRCPLVILEQGAWPLYGFPIANDQTTVAEQRLTAQVTRDHPITAGLGAQVALASSGIRLNRGVPGTATLLSQVDGGHALVAVRDPGERLPDGSLCPHRRVAFFATTDSLGTLTRTGVQVLEASLRWAAELAER
jgi:ferric-dicitrate binding protein FerR (iron transport regulator)